ncbi:MAG: glycosyltransferase family 4 protein [Gallionella sp.]|jgi:glycosyltransferase involved in cell wall biosynthesis
MAKKVVITLPVLFTGGTEIQTISLVKVLVTAGYDVAVLCFYDFEQKMVAAMEKTGARVVLLKLDRDGGLWLLLKSLTKFFRKERFYFCHVQYMAPGFIPVVAARLAGVPVVFATVHQPGHPYGKKAHYLLRIAAQLCTRFICISKSVESSWFKNSELFDVQAQKIQSRHCTIFNAVDVNAIAVASDVSMKYETRRQYHLGDERTIGCVARLRVEKGQKILIQAFSEVVKVIPDIKLLMIGDGPDKLELMLLAEELSVTESIIWLGRQDQADVYRLYGVMDVVVVPSLFEGFGLAAAEAMSAGVPVIASNIDGLAEVVRDSETGVLFPVGNSQALAASLIQLLNSPSLSAQFGKNGQVRVRDFFAIESFSESMLALYGHYLPTQNGAHK